MNQELTELRELASSRLTELESLQLQYQESLRVCEQLKMDLKTLPEAVVVETTEYKCLKSQYSVLFNEAQQIKSHLEEAKNLLQTTKNVHLRHIEQMEVVNYLFSTPCLCVLFSLLRIYSIYFSLSPFPLLFIRVTNLRVSGNCGRR